MKTLEQIKTLAELAEFLNNVQSTDGIDLSDLPTFGGKAPKNTSEVFSWDDDMILSCDFTLSVRCDCGEAYFNCTCD